MRDRQNQRNDNNANKKKSQSDLTNFIKDSQLIKVLNKKGIKNLLPIQYKTFNFIFSGEDVVAKDRTGSGKTIAYSLPTIMRLRQQKKFEGKREVRFLVVLPTRQLALQVKDEMESIGYGQKNDYNVVAVYGGASMIDQQRSLQKGADIIVGTPGRLLDFLRNGHIKFRSLQSICLDEADQMLNIGFKEDIEQIFKHIQKSAVKKVQCLMFSATIPNWIWQISEKYQSQNVEFVDLLKDGFTKTSQTVQHYCFQAHENESQNYLGPLIDYFFQGKSGSVIIFCETKREVERIGYSKCIPLRVSMLHGDFKQEHRERVFRKFKSGKAECLIATNVAARGLDFPQIDLIIQMKPPNSTDSYIHRSGRTGRVGKAGYCVTIYSRKQDYLMGMIENQAGVQFIHINPNQLNLKLNYNQNRYQNNDKRDYEKSNNYDKRYYNNYDAYNQLSHPSSENKNESNHSRRGNRFKNDDQYERHDRYDRYERSDNYDYRKENYREQRQYRNSIKERQYDYNQKNGSNENQNRKYKESNSYSNYHPYDH